MHPDYRSQLNSPKGQKTNIVSFASVQSNSAHVLLFLLLSGIFIPYRLVSRSRPFPFLLRGRRERVWNTAIELPILAFTQGRVSGNRFEVG